MTEGEVNIACKEWLLAQGCHSKGILNAKTKTANGVGYGQVIVPTDGDSKVFIDHQGTDDRKKVIIWIEAKGSDIGLSQLLEGFIRVAYACYYGAGKGLLAIPNKEYQELVTHKEFLTKVSRSSERILGLLNAENLEILWLE